MSENAVVRVDPSNVEQARAWDGGEGEYWAMHAERFDRSLDGYHDSFFDAAAIAPADQVLDIGCGTGQTTRDAARRSASGGALGVDLSSAMIDVARRLAASEGIGNATFQRADAQIHPFEPASFDVVISRTGASFFGDAVAGFTNIAGALRPRGRLAVLTWQPLPANEWIREISTAMAAGRALPSPPAHAPGPFALADPDRVNAVLSAAGFTEVELRPAAAPMAFGSDADDAHQFIVGLLGWMLEGLDEDGRRRALDGLRRTLEAHDTGQGVYFDSATWTILARRA